VKFTPTELPEVVVVEPDVFRDERGWFLETWSSAKYAEGGIRETFVQDNHSCSKRGALRGLHAQLDPPQGKLVRCTRGEVWDVAVDVRVGSPRFGRYAAVTLGADGFRQLWIPGGGFAHGFCVLSDEAEIEYKCTALYRAAGEIAIAWNDPELALPWPITAPVLSKRDEAAPRLAELRARGALPRFGA
jgi:dTDP-4-dehydrorhamnose 3,5-epimerase